MTRGDIFDAELPFGGSRPAVVVTRGRAVPWLSNVTVVAVTSRVRDLPTEVPLGVDHGLRRPCVANCDNLFTIPKSALRRHRGALLRADIERLDGALRIALDLDVWSPVEGPG